MKFLTKMKDGGPESTVTGYWLIEMKSLFSIVLLKFEGKSRETYHTHAFDCFSWLIKGRLEESFKSHFEKEVYLPSFIPFVTRKLDFHKVDSIGTSWVLSFRGPWSKTWQESDEASLNKTRVLTNGRNVIAEEI